MKKAYIFDLDGTLALFKEKGHRHPFGFEASLILEDEVNEPVARIYKRLAYEKDIEIILLSGREDYCRNETMQWLSTNNINGWSYLFMRKAGDNRKDSIVKEEIYREKIEPNYEILGVFDDRNQVVEMWRSLGLPCFQVANGDF